jgi:hypothetical protein
MITLGPQHPTSRLWRCLSFQTRAGLPQLSWSHCCGATTNAHVSRLLFSAVHVQNLPPGTRKEGKLGSWTYIYACQFFHKLANYIDIINQWKNYVTKENHHLSFDIWFSISVKYFSPVSLVMGSVKLDMN